MEDKLLLSKAVRERLASCVPRDTHVECVELTILGLGMSKDIIQSGVTISSWWLLRLP